MKLDKARKLFSDYYENTLSEGLREAFERALTNDNEVKREYDEFVRTLEAFDGLKAEVPVPADLHGQINRALQQHISESQPVKHQFGLLSALKPALYGGLAASLAILLIVSSSRQDADFGAAGIAGVSKSSPTFSVTRGTLALEYANAVDSISVIREDGAELVSSQAADSVYLPLQNNSEDAVLISVSIDAGEQLETMRIVLPGSKATTEAEGSGSLSDLAKSVSARYGVVVQIEGSASNLKWNLESVDPISSLKEESSQFNFLVTEDHSGIIRIRA